MFLATRRLADVIAKTASNETVRIIRHLVPTYSSGDAQPSGRITGYRQICRAHDGGPVAHLSGNKYKLLSGEIVSVREAAE